MGALAARARVRFFHALVFLGACEVFIIFFGLPAIGLNIPGTFFGIMIGQLEGLGLVQGFLNPLLKRFSLFNDRLFRFKEQAKSYYFEVMLSRHACPKCGGGLAMTGVSECSCEGGHSFDPTVDFQRSDCCNAALSRRTSHYVCSRCSRVVPSRFLFDERVL